MKIIIIIPNLNEINGIKIQNVVLCVERRMTPGLVLSTAGSKVEYFTIDLFLAQFCVGRMEVNENDCGLILPFMNEMKWFVEHFERGEKAVNTVMTTFISHG